MAVPLPVSSVPAQTPYVQYVSGSGQTVFPYPFEITLDSDLVCLINGVAQSTDGGYVLSGQGATGGGNLTFTVGQTAGTIITLYRNISIARITQLSQAGTFFSANFNNEFNRVYLIMQQLQQSLLPGGNQAYALMVPNSNNPAPTTLLTPANYANKFLGFDSYGNPQPSVLTSAGILSAAIIGGFITPQTQAETNASVVPLVQYPLGDMRRYGVVANSSGAAAANTTALRALFNPLVAGPTGEFYFPNISGSDVYYFSAGIPVRDGVNIDLQECTLNMTGTGVSNDTGSGLFTAVRDFECKNGTISINWATGVSTSSGNAFAFGARESDVPMWPLNPVFDSLLTLPMGNIKLSNLRINSTITGANVASASAISLLGGLQNVIFQNLRLVGSGTNGIQLGIVYEFGWATASYTGDSGHSTRQSSHMRNVLMSGIDISNYDNVANSFGIDLVGAYGTIVENYRFSGVANGFNIGTGECLNFRPWVGQDDVGAKRSIILRNIAGEGFSNNGITINGSTTRLANSGYLQIAWSATNAYVNGGGGSGTLKGMTVINGGKMYVCTASGTSASSGGPTGTSTGITDGTVTWDYVPLSVNTDLCDFSLDGFALSGASASDGIFTSAGHSDIRNGTILGSATGTYGGIVCTDACNTISIDNVNIFNTARTGIVMDFGVPIWSPARLKKFSIKNCYIAGCSSSSSGTYGAISVANFDGGLIENCRFGYEAAFAGLDEVFQAQAVLISAATGINLRIKGCRVAGAVGNIGFYGAAPPGTVGSNSIENCSYNTTGTNPPSTHASAPWEGDEESLTAVAIANGNTITTTGLRVSRVLPAGAVTGICMQGGQFPGQSVTVMNDSVYTVTMAAAGTSDVADGASCVIAALTQKTFFYNTLTGLWYHS